VRRLERGFTLIEIILVLALAGVILVAVFLAVSTAQRSRRDYQRKNDLARVVAAVQAYAANNRGQVPLNQAEADAVFNNYLQGVADPSSGSYAFTFRVIDSPHSDVPPVGTIYYQQGHWCSTDAGAVPDNPGDPITGNDTSVTKFVVWTGLEAGGQNGGSFYCLDNSPN
jgi:prepilin-type N-terminal cleavage/methylation domain-containing protein